MKWILKSFEELDLHELYSILTLRTEVFVVEQSCSYLETDGKDIDCYHLLGIDDCQLVAYLRILPPKMSYVEASIGRVVVASSYRAKGLGRTMMLQAMEYITSVWNETQIRIGAQAHLVDFYQSLGFAPVSDMYLEDNIPHVDMLYVKPAI